MQSPVTVDLNLLPQSENEEFRQSSFFSEHSTLPSLAEIRAEASRQSPQRINLDKDDRPPPVFFRDLSLVVKYGRSITMAEGQCMWLIKHYLRAGMPVPEVYGWRRDGVQFFIFMQLVLGVTLKECWSILSSNDKISICDDLRKAFQSLRTLRQDPEQTFVGHVGRQPLLDTFFEHRAAGPFASVHDMHEFFAFHPHPHDPIPEDPDPYRHRLPDNAPIVLTQGDLDVSNIIVSQPLPNGSSSRLRAIIDWHQGGWYPDYWEYCKAKRLVFDSNEWGKDYITTFLDEFEDFDYWCYYCGRLGE